MTLILIGAIVILIIFNILQRCEIDYLKLELAMTKTAATRGITGLKEYFK